MNVKARSEFEFAYYTCHLATGSPPVTMANYNKEMSLIHTECSRLVVLCQTRPNIQLEAKSYQKRIFPSKSSTIFYVGISWNNSLLFLRLADKLTDLRRTIQWFIDVLPIVSLSMKLRILLWAAFHCQLSVIERFWSKAFFFFPGKHFIKKPKNICSKGKKKKDIDER